ncbi:alkanesulfonate monooxygenase SsuD/methylene tetrahydromethanopterin reductase-like flavin-dependent oxidoreductase (luciferase family) [Pseudarthrobacter sp. SLBN-100]
MSTSETPVPSTSPAGFLAIELDGAGWDGGHFASLGEAVLAAESAGFHAATFTDAPVQGRANALQRAAYAGPATRTIALVPEVDTVYTEPFHVSTQLASLDYVSGGRAGWIATAAESPEGAAAVGRSSVSGEALAQEAEASIEVSRRLWDSWEDDAVIRDVAHRPLHRRGQAALCGVRNSGRFRRPCLLGEGPLHHPEAAAGTAAGPCRCVAGGRGTDSGRCR